MSTYLTDPTAFENTINRGGLSSRSTALANLVSAIKLYITNRFPDGSDALKQQVRQIASKYDAWKAGNPKEFANRFGNDPEKVAGFYAELETAYENAGMYMDAGGDAVEPAEGFHPAPRVAINRWRTVKQVAKPGLTVGSIGISAAQTATGTGLLAAATGAAIGATGIGLFVGAAVLQVGSSALAINSALKTSRHIKELQELYDKREQLEGVANCCELMWGDVRQQTNLSRTGHDMVANHVLPYIIRKKTLKYGRKIATAIPVVGLGETVRAIAQKARKRLNGTLGANRQTAAEWLASHFITCDCYLSQAIIADLYSVGEMNWLRERESYEEIASFLAIKMKST
jgi:hypothetical protein